MSTCVFTNLWDARHIGGMRRFNRLKSRCPWVEDPLCQSPAVTRWKILFMKKTTNLEYWPRGTDAIDPWRKTSFLFYRWRERSALRITAVWLRATRSVMTKLLKLRSRYQRRHQDCKWKHVSQVPEETCSMAPEEECKNVTTSIPQALALKLTLDNICFSPASSPAGVQTGAKGGLPNRLPQPPECQGQLGLRYGGFCQSV